MLIRISFLTASRKALHTRTWTHTHTHIGAHSKPLGDGNSQARYKCNPLFIIFLRDVAGSKKSYIFRSACGIHSHDVKITHTHTQKGWIPLISNQRGTLESHFLGACVSWLYKSLPSPLPSLWVSRFMAEGETEGASYWHYKTPSLSHWSSFIHWLTGPGNRQPPSIRGEGASEGSSPPRKKDTVKCFHLRLPS